MNIEDALCLAGSMYLEDRYADAEKVLEAQFSRCPDDPRIPYNLAIIKSVQGKFDECTRYCELSLKIKPDFHEVRDLLGHQRLRDYRWEEGFELFESRFNKPDGLLFFQCDCPLWDGMPLPGKRILIWGEQGLGDVVQFSRLLPVVRKMGMRVTFLAREELVELFNESGIADEVYRLEAALMPESERNFSKNKSFFHFNPQFLREKDIDCHLPIMSLGRVLKIDPERLPGQVPFLHVEPFRIDRARRELDKLCPPGVFRIGLVWAGSSHSHVEFEKTASRRRVPLRVLAPILERTDVCFISLQAGFAAVQRHEFAQIVAPPMTPSFADTAAYFQNVDILITIDTSACHVAGGLGIPVWLMNRYDTCWRWFRDRTDSPWYPSMKIFRQKRFGDWEGVVHEIQLALSKEKPLR